MFLRLDSLALRLALVLVLVALPSAQASCPDFLPFAGSPLPVAGNSISVVSDDFDHDGNPDIVSANYYGNTISVLLGAGNGTFAPHVDYSDGPGTYRLVSGDLDRDGEPDLVTSDYYGGVGVFLGVGDGTFAPRLGFSAGANPTSTTIGDWNRDGRPDLAVANGGGASVSILLGVGDGTFGSPASFPVGNNPTWIVSGDFDRDGDLDLSTTDAHDAAVSVLLGNGDGTFAARLSYPAGNHAAAAAPGDIDRDGQLDLVVVNYLGSSVSLLLGQGDGTFLDGGTLATDVSPTGIALVDIDRDGNWDIVTATHEHSTVGVFLGHGDGTFEPRVDFNAGSVAAATAAADFDRDGRTDLAVANLGGPQVALLLNRCSALACGAPAFEEGVGSPLATADGPVAVSSGDFDRDGRTDLAAADLWAGAIAIHRGESDGSFSAGVSFATGGTPYSVEASDLDRDGDLDLAAANYQDLAILLGDGTGGFAPAVHYAAGAGPVATAAADYDGDGDLDLAVGDYFGSSVSVLAGNGDGTFGAAVAYPTGGGAYQLEAYDLDRDGAIDLVVPNSAGGTISVLLGHGDGTFAPQAVYTVGSSASSIAIGDFDRDGTADLAVANYSSNDLSVLLGAGDGTFASAVNYPAGANARTVRAADFDRDGVLDLVVANASGASASLLLGRGDGTFEARIDFAAGAGSVGLMATDFDLDGRSDVVVANLDADSLTLLRNSCAGALSPPPTILSVQTQADASGAELEENEATRQAIFSLIVTFSEPVADAHAAVGQSGFVYGGNVALVADGGDFTVETTGCASGLAPTDVAVGVESAYFDAATGRLTLDVAGSYLPDAHYRLFVCSGNGLIDADDQPVDGDGNGVAGGEFGRSFQVDRTEPNGPSMPESPDHSNGECTGNPTFTMIWSGAFDEPGGSGLAGYSFEWLMGSVGDPDDIVDLPHGADPHQYTETLAENPAGRFFALKTCDRAGNCSGTSRPGYTIDTTAPTPPTGLHSSHTPGVASANDTITMAWTSGVDALCGHAGYSWTFTDSEAPSCPPAVVLPPDATVLPGITLGNGNWYFHICGVDRVGNWGETATAGPYVIDTQGPGPVTNLQSPTHATPSTEGRIEVTWTPPVDAIAGLGGYWWSFDTEPTTACPGFANAPADSAAAATEVLAPGAYYFHICTVDLLGNWSSPVHGGPYVIEPGQGGAQYVYFSDESYGTIERMRTDGTERVVLLSGLASPWGVAVDDAAGRIYWVEGGLAEIRRANLDGSGIETIVSGTGGAPFDLALDTARGKIYWTEYPGGGDALRRANLDGSDIEDLVTSGLLDPVGLGLDLSEDRIYWGEDTYPGRISRSRLDGSDREEIDFNGGFLDVAVDAAHDRIYTTVTTAAYSGGILRSHRDGSARTFITPSLPYPLLVTLDPATNRLYWTDLIAHTVERIYVDGTGRETLANDLGQARGIALSNVAMDPHETIPPANPTTFTSTHPENGWSNDATIGFTWSGAADEPGGSGLAGYSYVLDTLSGTVPDSTLDLPQTSDPHSTSVPAGEGDHFFHLVTCDVAGNCSEALEHGPYRVDLTAPSSPAIASSSHSATPSADTTIDVSWSAATDAASGVDGYGYLFSTSATASCPATKLVEETTLAATSAALSPGSWYFHLCAVDVAGNWSAVVTGGPYEISTTLPTVRLVDSSGQGIAGAVATYYQAGWKPFGTTGADGRVSLAIPPASYPFRLSYGGATVSKTQHVGTTPEVLFATRDVTIRFRDSAGGILESPTTEYYGGAWRPIGATSGGEVHKELLPAPYTFALTYLGTRNTKAQDVAANPVVDFATRDVTLAFRDSLGGTLESVSTEFYSGGWRAFGATSGGEAHKELLPASYTFALTYLGTRNTKAQDVAANPLVTFATRDVTVRFRDSVGGILESATTEFYSGGWRAFGATSGGEAHKELLPASYTFALTYLGQRNTKAQDAAVNPVVDFATRDVTIRLRDSAGGILNGATTEFYAGGWRTFGAITGGAGGEVHKELLPASYTFALTYQGQRNTKVQDVAASATVQFDTGAVFSDSATCNAFYAGGWRTFSQGIELLPATYTFRFTSGTPAQQPFAISAGTANHIR